MPTRAEAETYIRGAAEARGIDPDVAVQVARSEGLYANPNEAYQSNVYNGNRREPSFGPFQLHRSYLGRDFEQATGLDLTDPDNWAATVDFALDHAATNGWGAFHGAANTGISNQEGLQNAQVFGPVVTAGIPTPRPDMTMHEQVIAGMNQARDAGQLRSFEAISPNPTQAETFNALQNYNPFTAVQNVIGALSGGFGNQEIQPQAQTMPSLNAQILSGYPVKGNVIDPNDPNERVSNAFNAAYDPGLYSPYVGDLSRFGQPALEPVDIPIPQNVIAPPAQPATQGAYMPDVPPEAVYGYGATVNRGKEPPSRQMGGPLGLVQAFIEGLSPIGKRSGGPLGLVGGLLGGGGNAQPIGPQTGVQSGGTGGISPISRAVNQSPSYSPIGMTVTNNLGQTTNLSPDASMTMAGPGGNGGAK